MGFFFSLCCLTHLCLCVFVPADVMEGKSAILLGMSQWNSNDLVEQIETLGQMEHQSHGTLCTHNCSVMIGVIHTHTLNKLKFFLLTHP